MGNVYVFGSGRSRRYGSEMIESEMKRGSVGRVSVLGFRWCVRCCIRECGVMSVCIVSLDSVCVVSLDSVWRWKVYVSCVLCSTDTCTS